MTHSFLSLSVSLLFSLFLTSPPPGRRQSFLLGRRPLFLQLWREREAQRLSQAVWSACFPLALSHPIRPFFTSILLSFVLSLRIGPELIAQGSHFYTYLPVAFGVGSSFRGDGISFFAVQGSEHLIQYKATTGFWFCFFPLWTKRHMHLESTMVLWLFGLFQVQLLPVAFPLPLWLSLSF